MFKFLIIIISSLTNNTLIKVEQTQIVNLKLNPVYPASIVLVLSKNPAMLAPEDKVRLRLVLILVVSATSNWPKLLILPLTRVVSFKRFETATDYESFM